MATKEQKRAKVVYDLAVKYWKDAHDAGYTSLLKPEDWLVNQDELCKAWDEFKQRTNIKDVSTATNPFVVYTEFMYKQYEPGCGKMLVATYKDKKKD